jgi:hypothetical protein
MMQQCCVQVPGSGPARADEANRSTAGVALERDPRPNGASAGSIACIVTG